MTSNLFSYLVFLSKKEDKKFFEKFFLICSSYFSKLIKDTETVLFREEQHKYRLLFGPTKLPSSSMTRSFFCQKTSIFFSKKFLGSFLLELVYLMTETNNGVHGFVISIFRLKVMSKFFFALDFFSKESNEKKFLNFFHFVPICS